MGSSPAGEAVLRQRLSLLLLASAALVPAARVEAGPVTCPVRRVTGRPCPGCGGTRSVVRLLHGRPRAALDAHPLGPPLSLLLLAWAVTGQRSAGTALDPRCWRLTPPVRAALVVWAAWALRRAVRAT